MPDRHRSPTPTTSILKIEVYPAGGGSDYPRVRFLIDGSDRLKHARRTEFQGFSAMELLADASVLVPPAGSRRVALYECSCGDAGCGSLAAVIGSDGYGRVRWSDFQDFTAVFDGPVELNDPDGDEPFSDGVATNLPAFTFDRGQYEAEVERAVADRSWESDARRLDRLLTQLLRTGERQRLTDAGVQLGTVWSTQLKNGVVSVTLDLFPTTYWPERGSLQQILVSVRAEAGSAEDQAAEVAAKLAATPVENWESTFRHRMGRRF